MLHSVKALDGLAIAATDGKLGHVKDIYFDDVDWVIRYFEVDTGGWLTGRNVLISPLSVVRIDWERDAIAVDLTRSQVEDSPGIDTAKPVSRQHEEAFSNYYGYPYYWTGPYIWGYTLLPRLTEPPAFTSDHSVPLEPVEEESAASDPHLRSKDEVIGYEIAASDGPVGHVEDFLFDERDWTMPLLVVDTRDWWPGKHVLISPRRIEHVSWEDKAVSVNVARAQIENAPEYDEHHPPARESVEEVYGKIRRTGNETQSEAKSR